MEENLSLELGTPDAVTPMSKLFVKEKCLITKDLICGGFGSTRPRNGKKYEIVRINLDDIVRVEDRDGFAGSVCTRTFYADSCKIENDNDDLDIGSTQHDYYDCVDIEPSFLIFTKSRRYKIDCDIENEAETIWDWIVDYFENKEKRYEHQQREQGRAFEECHNE